MAPNEPPDQIRTDDGGFKAIHVPNMCKPIHAWASGRLYLPVAQMIQPKNISCRWYSSVFFLWQPTGHWFSCQMGVCHWSPSVAKTDEDQQQPMFFCNIIWAYQLQVAPREHLDSRQLPRRRIRSEFRWRQK